MLNQLAKHLFEPSDKISNESDRRTARLTSVLTFALLIQRLLDNVALIIYNADSTLRSPFLLMTLFVFTIYLLSRTQYARTAANALIWTFFGFVILIFNWVDNPVATHLVWLILPVTLATLLQSVRQMLIVWVVSLVCIFALPPILIPDLDIVELIRAFGLIFATGILLLSAALSRQHDRRLIEKQNRELGEQKLVLERTNQILEKTVVGQSTKLQQNSAELKREKQTRNETELVLQKKQRLEGIGLLASGIAHDFNNLLAVITLQIALATRQLGLDSPAQKHLQQASAQVKQSSTITRQLLAYAKDSQNAAEQMNLGALVLDICTLLERIIDSNVTLTCNIRHDSAHPMTVLGDTAQLQQVVMNLIVNAADAIKDEEANSTGIVTVSLAYHEIAHADILSQDMLNRDYMTTGKHFELRVQDTGCGMDEETIDQIFEPFFTTKQTGHGLGLSAVLGILRRHKAGLVVESEVGHGTTFRVFFPEYVSTDLAEAVPPAGNPSNSEPPHVEGLHVLLIDDDTSVQEATAELLELEGCSVEVAENGHLGLIVFESNPQSFDLILLDLDMPVMSGIPTFHALREVSPTLPIVFHSGNSANEIAGLLAAEPATAFLPKPYSRKELQKAISVFLLNRNSGG